jgi:chromosome segregation ATPase
MFRLFLFLAVILFFCGCVADNGSIVDEELLDAKVKIVRSSIHNYLRMLEVKRAEEAKVARQVLAARVRIKVLEKMRNKEEKKITESSADLYKLKRVHKDLKARQKQLNAQVAKGNAALKAGTGKKNQLGSQLNALNGQIAALAAKIKEAQKAQAAAQANLNAAHAATAGLNQQIAAEQGKHRGFTAQISTIKANRAKLEKDLQANQKVINGYIARTKAQRDQMEKLKAEAAALEKQLNNLKKKLDTMRANVENEKKKIEKMKPPPKTGNKTDSGQAKPVQPKPVAGGK